MEDSKKKPIMVGLILACIAAAVAVTLITKSKDEGGVGGLGDEIIWVKCANETCGAESQMPTDDYYKYIKDNGEQPVCDKCGENSLYRAVKCAKCGVVFFRGEIRGDFPDRCPECGFSQMEGDRKK